MLYVLSLVWYPAAVQIAWPACAGGCEWHAQPLDQPPGAQVEPLHPQGQHINENFKSRILLAMIEKVYAPTIHSFINTHSHSAQSMAPLLLHAVLAIWQYPPKSTYWV